MACLRQKRFRNPIAEERRTPYDKYTIHGNCGNCAACAKQKQNDWLVRSYFEYLSRPYTCYFVTLDFNEHNLPRYNGHPCFDTELMTRFFDSLRGRLNTDLRYLYSSHLGEALHRPHYHVIFFLYDNIPEDDFWSAIGDLWHYGSHQDIQKLKSCRGSVLKSIEYVCRYTTYSFKIRDIFKSMQYRYRPHTIASIGYGAQAMSRDEIDCTRLDKQGLQFLKTPVITRDLILSGKPVYLDIKDDGILVPFSIPRYYETKLMFDRHTITRTKIVDSGKFDEHGNSLCVELPYSSSELIKNEYGKQLQINRHNVHYVTLFNDFVNSASLPIHNDEDTQYIVQKVFPDSPYLGVAWYDVVNDVTIDREKFLDFCKYYNWIEFDCNNTQYFRYRPLRWRTVLSHDQIEDFNPKNAPWFSLKGFGIHAAELDGRTDQFDDDVDLFIYAMSEYQIYQDVLRYRQADFEDWKSQENIKEKIKKKAETDIKFYWHLKRHKFNFSTLNPKKYVSSKLQAREDFVSEQSSA